MAPCVSFWKSHKSGCGTPRGENWDGGKTECKLSEVNTRAVSRVQSELIDEFKIAAGDVISVGGKL